MIGSDFFYHNPKAVYLILFVAPFLVFFFLLFRYRNHFLHQLGSQPILNHIVYQRSGFNFWKKVIFFCVAWILATVALMDPRGNPRYPETNRPVEQEKQHLLPLKRKAHEVMFLIDSSLSMAVDDMKTGQTRLDFAKDVIDETIRRLKGETVSIYTFASDTDKIVPSTLDYVFARLMARNLSLEDLGTQGTDLLQALQSIDRDYASRPNEKLKTLIIFSDGEDLPYETGNSSGKEARKEKILEALGNTQLKNLRVYSIGLGTGRGGEVPGVTYRGKKVTSRLTPELLQSLANEGRGNYYKGNDFTSTAIAEEILEQMSRDHPFLDDYEAEQRVYLDKQGKDFIYDRYYQKFIFVAMILIAFILLFPENWKHEEFN